MPAEVYTLELTDKYLISSQKRTVACFAILFTIIFMLLVWSF